MEEKDFQRIEQMIGKAVRTEVGPLKDEIKTVRAEVGTVKDEIKAVRAEVGTVKDEIKAVRAEVGSFKEEIRAEVGSVKDEIKAVRADVGNFKEEIKDDFHLQVGILSEDFQHKLQFVAEGHQMLSEKMERMHGELNSSIRDIDKKIDAVAADLAAHRADTEGHKRGYMVREP